MGWLVDRKNTSDNIHEWAIYLIIVAQDKLIQNFQKIAQTAKFVNFLNSLSILTY